MTSIYGIINSQTNELVYVGATQNAATRLKQHRCGIGRDFKEHCDIAVFEETTDESGEDESFWINYFLSLGCNLVNKRTKATPKPLNPVRSGFLVSGKKLKELRIQANKTQAQVAAVAKCTPQNIYYMEKREFSSVNIHVLKPIARCLGVSYKDLADC